MAFVYETNSKTYLQLRVELPPPFIPLVVLLLLGLAPRITPLPFLSTVKPPKPDWGGSTRRVRCLSRWDSQYASRTEVGVGVQVGSGVGDGVEVAAISTGTGITGVIVGFTSSIGVLWITVGSAIGVPQASKSTAIGNRIKAFILL